MNKYRPSQRLHNPGEYSAVFKRRGMIRGSCFDLHHSESSRPQARLGLVIAKRFARSAVLRNLIKRQIREMFRQRGLSLPVEDVVFRLARPLLGLPVAKNDQRAWIRAEVQSLLDRVTEVSRGRRQ